MLGTVMTRATTRTTTRLATLHRHVSSATPSPASEIVVEETGSTRIYTLNRPKALNALSHDMFLTLSSNADEWRDDPTVKLIVGQGEGRAFAAGGDIKAVVDAARRGNSKLALTLMADSYRMNWKMTQLGKPYIAIIDGIVMGGGAGVSFPAEIRIATKRTMFAMPEQRIGFSPDAGASYFLTQLDGYIGTWLAVTGVDVFGRAAYDLGIATHYVAEEAVPEITERVAALQDPTAESVSALVAEYHIEGNDDPTSKSNPDGKSLITGKIRSFLDATFSLPSLPAIYRRLQEAESDEKLNPDVRKWAVEQRSTMDTRGPTGMAVVVEHYRLARAAKRYATSLEYDLLLGAAFAGTKRSSNDLLVGAVHMLFDKHKTPIPFNPTIKDLDNPVLAPDNIRAKFLSRAHLPEALEGDLKPPPRENVGPDAKWGQYRTYGLPSEAAVRAAAGEDCVSVDELVRRVLRDRGDARREEFERVVRRIAAERMVLEGGRLVWQT